MAILSVPLWLLLVWLTDMLCHRHQISQFPLPTKALWLAGAPVTPDYAGYHPWAFTGGTIKKVIVDVSGESYLDLELEAMAAFKRD